MPWIAFVLVWAVALPAAGGLAASERLTRLGEPPARSWFFAATALALFEANDKGEAQGAGLGVGYRFGSGLDLQCDLAAARIEAREHAGKPGGEGAGLLGDVLLRWHFVRGERWSLYADGVVGVLQFSRDFPAGGGRFNFSESAGLGFGRRVAGLDFLAGARWIHISNARIYGRRNNPGFDGAAVYLAVLQLL